MLFSSFTNTNHIHFSESQGLGNGDIAYNAKRSLLALIPIQSKFIYHLVKIEDHSVTLWRKTKWHDTHISN